MSDVYSKKSKNDEDIFSPCAVFESANPERLREAVVKYMENNGEDQSKSEQDRLFVHCLLYCLSRYRYHTRVCSSTQETLVELARQRFCARDESVITIVCTLKEISTDAVTKWEKHVEGLKAGGPVELDSEFFQRTEQAFEFDPNFKYLSMASDTEIFGEHWDRVFTHWMNSMRDSIRVSSNIEFRELEKKRKQIVEDFITTGLGRATHIGDLIDRLLLIYHNLRPEHIDIICERFQFHHRYLDDEFKSIAIMLDESSGSDIPSVFIHLFGHTGNVAELNVALLCIVMFISECEDLGRGLFLSKYLRMASFQLYRALRDIAADSLADGWLKFRFDTSLNSQYITNLVARTHTFFSEIPGDVILRSSSTRIELNGEKEGVEYKLPELKTSSPNPRKTPPLRLEQFGLGTKRTSDVAEPPVRVSSAASSSATTVVDGFTEEYYGPTPEQQLEFEQNNLRRNRTVAKIFTKNRRLSDDHMRRMRIPYVSVNIPSEERITFYENDGKTIGTTNLRKGGVYHCLRLTYDLTNEDWLIEPDWCRLDGLLPLDEMNKGANREVLVGDGSHFQILIHGEDKQFVYKRHRCHIKHDNMHYLGEIKSQSLARHYADRFHEATEDRFGCLRMLHADFIVVFENSKCETIIDFMNRERYFTTRATAINFHKFTNNSVWKNETVDTSLYEAFSHFTFDCSGGELMVTDLQGWVGVFYDKIVYMLTDPVILCECKPRSLLGHPLINSGTTGMKNFFRKVHPKCNDICQQLELKRHPEFDGCNSGT